MEWAAAWQQMDIADLKARMDKLEKSNQRLWELLLRPPHVIAALSGAGEDELNVIREEEIRDR